MLEKTFLEMDVNTVFLKDMPFMLSVGKDAWNRENKPQPVSITLRVNNVKSIHDAAASDDISQSLDYGKLYKNIQSKLGNPGDQHRFADIAKQVLAAVEVPETSSSVEVDFPKAALRAEGGLRYTVNGDKDRDVMNVHKTLQILGIKCACIIGVNPHERREKQIVVVNLTFRGEYNTKDATAIEIALDHYREIIEMVVKVCQLLILSSALHCLYLVFISAYCHLRPSLLLPLQVPLSTSCGAADTDANTPSSAHRRILLSDNRSVSQPIMQANHNAVVHF